MKTARMVHPDHVENPDLFTADASIDSLPEDSTVHFSKYDKDYVNGNGQVPANMHLSLISMMQALDKKLEYMHEYLNEMNSNFDGFKGEVSSRFDSLDPQLRNIKNLLTSDNSKPAQGARRVSFCAQPSYSGANRSEKKLDTSGLGSGVKKRRGNLIHKSKAYSSSASKEFNVKRVEKADDEKMAISNLIKISSYYKFSMCCDEELKDIVDSFDVEKFGSGSLIINQGDAFERFYIVKSGIVDVYVDGSYISSLSYREALDSNFMMGSASVSTFRARNECEIWYLLVDDLRRISTHYKRKRLSLKTNFLKMVRL